MMAGHTLLQILSGFILAIGGITTILSGFCFTPFFFSNSDYFFRDCYSVYTSICIYCFTFYFMQMTR